MKLLIGIGAAGLLAIGATTCPETVRDQAREAVTLSPAMHAEISRQIDMFMGVMEGERPDIHPVDSQ
jgi:hypothetical protein